MNSPLQQQQQQQHFCHQVRISGCGDFYSFALRDCHKYAKERELEYLILEKRRQKTWSETLYHI